MGKESTVYLPCKQNQTPDYDEVVVFSKKQILPRYLIYFTRNEVSKGIPLKESDTSTNTDIPLEIRDAHLVVLWIVPNPTEKIQLMKGWLMDHIGRLVIIQHTFCQEFKNWTTKWGLDNIHKLSIAIFPPNQNLQSSEIRLQESNDFIEQVISLLVEDKIWQNVNLYFYSDSPPASTKKVKKLTYGCQSSKLLEFSIPKTTSQFLDRVEFDNVCASGVLLPSRSVIKSFTFSIISGKNLSSKESKPYCIYGFIDKSGKFDKNLSQKMVAKKIKTINPKWTKEDFNSKEFFWSNGIPCQEFKVECWASKTIGGDEFLGQFMFPLEKITETPNGQQEITLNPRDRKDKVSGSILIRWDYK